MGVIKMGVPIGVDVDSTLTQPDSDPWWGDWTAAQPNTEVIELVNELYKRHTIIIWTARPESMRNETEWLLKDFGVRYNALVMDKTSVAVMIDDKAVQPDTALDWNVKGVEEFVYD